MARQYKYRSLPITIAPPDQIWAVSGKDLINKGAGVLEWCYNRQDAFEMMRIMRGTLEFSNLRAAPYQESKPTVQKLIQEQLKGK